MESSEFSTLHAVSGECEETKTEMEHAFLPGMQKNSLFEDEIDKLSANASQNINYLHTELYISKRRIEETLERLNAALEKPADQVIEPLNNRKELLESIAHGRKKDTKAFTHAGLLVGRSEECLSELLSLVFKLRHLRVALAHKISIVKEIGALNDLFVNGAEEVFSDSFELKPNRLRWDMLQTEYEQICGEIFGIQGRIAKAAETLCSTEVYTPGEVANLLSVIEPAQIGSSPSSELVMSAFPSSKLFSMDADAELQDSQKRIDLVLEIIDRNMSRVSASSTRVSFFRDELFGETYVPTAKLSNKADLEIPKKKKFQVLLHDFELAHSDYEKIQLNLANTRKDRWRFESRIRKKQVNFLLSELERLGKPFNMLTSPMIPK